MNILAWLEFLLLFVGVALILFGGYLYFQQWSHVKIRTHEYSYISEMERDKRSLKSGFSAVIIVLGVCFIISAITIKPITISSVLFFLILGACSSPLVLLAVVFRVRKDLEPYTKMKDDVVFLDENKSKKH